MKGLAYGCSVREPTAMAGSDSLSVKTGECAGERTAFAVLARAQGDRDAAELAGSTAVRLFSDCFVGMLSSIAADTMSETNLRIPLEKNLRTLQSRVTRYAAAHARQVEVDITCLMMTRGDCCILSTGGSVVCRIGVNSCDYLMDAGARAPVWYFEPIMQNAAYLICSEEIASTWKPDDLSRFFNPNALSDAIGLKMRLDHIIRQKNPRSRCGSHSAILIKTMEESCGC